MLVNILKGPRRGLLIPSSPVGPPYLFGRESSMRQQIALIGVLLLASCSASAGDPYVNGFPTDRGFFPIGVWLQSPTPCAA
jgi:hypothetical protein